MEAATALLVLALATATPAAAQSSQATLEASIFRGTAGYARHVTPRVLIGAEAGFGFPQIDRTLTPSTDQEGWPDFEEYLHIGAFARFAPNRKFELDAGLRGSVASLWECTASDCWPALFGGAYLQPMVGWTHIKLGARLTAGWIAESAQRGSAGSTFLVGLNPFIVRATLPF